MPYTFSEIQATDTLKESHPKLVANFEALRAGFNGTEFPPSPVKGQKAFINDVWYTFNGATWAEDSTLHNHRTEHYTKGEVNTKLDGKSNTGHQHTDQHFTKAESNILLDGKAEKIHGHTDQHYTKAEQDSRFVGVNGKAADSDKLDGHDSTYFSPATHTHGNNYTKDEIATELSKLDSRYYTETEVDALLAGKAATAHNHENVMYAQDAEKLEGKTGSYYRCTGCTWTCMTGCGSGCTSCSSCTGSCTGGCKTGCTSCNGCSSCMGCGACGLH